MRGDTLAVHGASTRDISFLRHRRVKPNAMPADVFVRFLERKLAEHGIGKVVPDNNVLEQHARHILTRALTNKALGAIRAKATKMQPRSHCLPICTASVAAALRRQPDIPWGLAFADIARKALHERGYILGAAIVPARDLAPLLPLEAVVKAIAVRCHQPHCRRREMDRQQQRIGIRDGR